MMELQGLQSNIEVVYRREDHSHPHVLVVFPVLKGKRNLEMTHKTRHGNQQFLL